MPIPHNPKVQELYKEIQNQLDENEKAHLLAMVIDNGVNSFSGDRRIPVILAETMVETHNTLQSSWIRMLLNTIVAYADLYEKRYGLSYTDRRNEYAVKAAVEIRGLLRDGKLPLPFI